MFRLSVREERSCESSDQAEGRIVGHVQVKVASQVVRGARRGRCRWQRPGSTGGFFAEGIEAFGHPRRQHRARGGAARDDRARDGRGGEVHLAQVSELGVGRNANTIVHQPINQDKDPER